MSADFEVAIVGAGAVGLACAAALARAGHEVVVLERHPAVGRETTSRNSGVIHAGIYYPVGSLKAQTCVEGRELLYARCARDAVAHRKIGKLIVATREGERATLESLLARGLSNGAGALRLVEGEELRRLEPRVRALAGLLSPESGIVDALDLCRSYAAEASAHGASFALRTMLEGLEPEGDGWGLLTRGPDGARARVGARVVVNAAGLESDRVAAMAGLDVDAIGWRLHPCKGDYFAIAPRLGPITSRLVYPVPAGAGLGVHVTMDLSGAFRAGPDAEYVDAQNDTQHVDTQYVDAQHVDGQHVDAQYVDGQRYDVAPEKAALFGEALRRYLPEIANEDLSPDYAGVRPKLQGPGEPVRDFVLDEHPDAPGVLHLVGIESPGITASEALARRVVDRVADRIG